MADRLERTKTAEAFLLPLHLAGGHLETAQCASAGVATEAVEVTIDQHAGVEVVAHVFVFPNLGGLAAGHLQQGTAAVVSGGNEHHVAQHDWVS